MKRNICIIAPIPPPMTGNSKAVETIIESDECNELFNFFPVNLSIEKYIENGKFSVAKIKMVINALKTLSRFQSSVKIDTYYLTIAQSTLGCLRDIALLNQIYRKNRTAIVVLHLHGGGFQKFYLNSNSILRKLIKKYYSKANKFIVLSNSLKCMFNGIVDENKVQVIENCVDNEFLIFKQNASEKLKKTMLKEYIEIIYLSNMIETKGCFDVLKSAKMLQDKHVHCKFIFAGKFISLGEKNEFLNFIDDNNLSESVSYLGEVGGERKKRLLRQGDAFILPTYYPQEGQPISILEAMSACMAIITTQHGGIPDVISEGINGRFVEKKNPIDIANVISELVENPEMIVKMGINNRNMIMKKYLESDYVNNIIDVLS